MTFKADFSEEELLAELAKAVHSLDVQRTGDLCQYVLNQRYSARKAILEGLSAGMRRVGEKFCSHQYFVPEVLVAARAMYRGINLLKPQMLAEGGEGVLSGKGKISIGVVEGDLHDIGKNIVKLMLDAEGFTVTDLGKNLPTTSLLSQLETDAPDLLALSTLMTSTLPAMKKAVAETKARFPQVKVIVGGAPVTEAFVRDVGADGTASEATGAVKLALQLLQAP